MKNLTNKTKKMLEVEKQYGMPIEELLRTMFVDMNKSVGEIANIIGTTRATAQGWYDQINVTSNGIAKDLIIPFSNDTEFFKMFMEKRLNDDQIKFGFEMKMGGNFVGYNKTELVAVVGENYYEKYSILINEAKAIRKAQPEFQESNSPIKLLIEAIQEYNNGLVTIDELKEALEYSFHENPLVFNDNWIYVQEARRLIEKHSETEHTTALNNVDTGVDIVSLARQELQEEVYKALFNDNRGTRYAILNPQVSENNNF